MGRWALDHRPRSLLFSLQFTNATRQRLVDHPTGRWNGDRRNPSELALLRESRVEAADPTVDLALQVSHVLRVLAHAIELVEFIDHCLDRHDLAVERRRRVVSRRPSSTTV